MVNTVSIEEMLYTDFCDIVESYSLLENLDRLTYLFSGGKDATIGLDFLQRFLRERGRDIPLDVVMVTYPKHVYFLPDGSPNECFTKTVDYWKQRQIELNVFVPEAGDFADGDSSACGICKRVRKSYVDPYLKKLQLDYPNETIGVMTGYTLYDALAYMDEILLVTNFRNNDLLENDPIVRTRTQNCLHKMKAREELPNGLVVIRPLINMHENLIMDYVLDSEIPYVSTGCKASKDKHKREYFKMLNVATPINNTNYKGLLRFLQTMMIDLPDTFEDISIGNYFTDC